jgi:biotin carboxyl carrier protein
MLLETQVGDHLRTVSVEAAGGTELVVTVDGRRYRVDAVRAGDSRLSLILLDRGHASRTVAVLPRGRGELDVWLADGTAFGAVVDARRRHSTSAGGEVSGEQRVTAPMPGRVVRVLVGVGDHVAARQPVIVVEAMKMENELRSPKAGQVKEVSAVDGMTVEAGRLLIVIE